MKIRSGSGPRRIACGLVLAAATGLFAAASLAATDSGAGSAPPALAGIWKLNEKQSETWAQKMEAMRGGGGERGGERGQGGWGGGRGGGGWGGGGGMGGGGWGGGRGGFGGGGREGGRRGGPGEGPDGANASNGGPRDSTRMRDMQWLQDPPATLLIEQSDSAVVLSQNTVTLQVLAFAGGDSAATNAASSGPQWFRARWQGARLDAERAGSGGRKRSETFEVGKDGKSLVIVTRVETGGGRPPIELRRVYDRYEGN